ncbi:TetR family transcriptional regulator [Gracilibacillus halophilus YIM-C55.5]|uniref:TetR family transcriptional regulator n=1 Tax=Gracilibacillus halophilus YIM-C55.5 TaxID=1308866 RepID=N4W8I7_9BACI|nr:TetR/AcrR family transcriptional regulator [Gracilibacillus halophilus]ENH96573.1 TetR family transcriptional regulator [Gracilibacillus halophilus YIM-C55.5]
MEAKKQRIIEESMKLFSEKGYHATSIQEIATNSDISKGAFYLYFESKDDLLHATFQYFTNSILQKVETIQEKSIEPKAKLTEQMATFLSFFRDHKEYLMLYIRDYIKIGDKMDDLIIHTHQHSFMWSSLSLKNIYGEAIEPFIVDAVITMDGIMQGYLKWMALHDFSFDADELATFIFRRIDAAIQSLIQEEQSMFQLDQLQHGIGHTNPSENQIVQQLRQQLHRFMHEPAFKDAEEAIQALEEEVQKDEPKKVIIESMLAYLEQWNVFQSDCQELRKKYSINK